MRKPSELDLSEPTAGLRDEASLLAEALEQDTAADHGDAPKLWTEQFAASGKSGKGNP